MTLRTTGFMDLVHRPEFKYYETQRFGNITVFTWGQGGTYSVGSQRWLRLALSNGPNSVGGLAFLHLKKITNSVSETLFFSYLEFWMMHKAENSEILKNRFVYIIFTSRSGLQKPVPYREWRATYGTLTNDPANATLVISC
jgi:hypothetical protein